MSGRYREAHDISSCILAAVGLPQKDRFKPIRDLVIKNGKIIYAPYDPVYKEYLKYMRKLYEEELLDQEYFSQSQQQWAAKGFEHLYGFTGAPANFTLVQEDYHDYDLIEPLTSKFSNKKQIGVVLGVNQGKFAITNVNKYPEVSVRYIDWWYNVENGALHLFGPEVGLFPDGGGLKYYEDGSWELVPGGDYNGWEWRNRVLSPSNSHLPFVFPAEFHMKQKGRNAELAATTMEHNVPYNVETLPGLYYTMEETSMMQTLSMDLDRKSTRLNSSHIPLSRMPSSA